MSTATTFFTVLLALAAYDLIGWFSRKIILKRASSINSDAVVTGTKYDLQMQERHNPDRPIKIVNNIDTVWSIVFSSDALHYKDVIFISIYEDGTFVAHTKTFDSPRIEIGTYFGKDIKGNVIPIKL